MGCLFSVTFFLSGLELSYVEISILDIVGFNVFIDRDELFAVVGLARHFKSSGFRSEKGKESDR